MNTLRDKIKRNGTWFVGICAGLSVVVSWLMYDVYSSKHIIPDIKLVAFTLLLCSTVVLSVCWYGIYHNWWASDNNSGD